MTAGIVDCLTLNDGFSTVDLVVLQKAAARRVNFYFHVNPELTDVAQDRAVNGRDAPGPEVLVVTFVEGAGLSAVSVQRHFGAAARGPEAAAGTLARLQQRTLIAKLAQFIGGYQTSDAGAENRNANAFACTGIRADHRCG